MSKKPWTTVELHHASRMWKAGESQRTIVDKLGRTIPSFKNVYSTRRDLFPMRKQARGELGETVAVNVDVTAYVYSIMKEEAKRRGISLNILVRETFRDRFVRKLWKPQASTSTAKVKYFNGSRG